MDGLLPWPAGLLKLWLDLYCRINRQGIEPYLGDIIQSTFHIGLHLDTYKLISFKFGVQINTAKLYSFIPVWITLTFI